MCNKSGNDFKNINFFDVNQQSDQLQKHTNIIYGEFQYDNLLLLDQLY